MSKIIFGCDPDSEKSGMAVYQDGELILLKSMPLVEIYALFREYESRNPVLHIENLCGNKSSAFHYKTKDSQQVKGKKSENVGMCKQVQKEVERLAEYYGIEIVHHKVSSKWKDAHAGKREFQMCTKWNGSSNEDTRSAAYFGFLGCR